MDISKYLNVKYKFNGRGKKNQYDCIGLVIHVLNDNKINIPETDGKPINKNWVKNNPDRLINFLNQHGEQIDINEKLPLDLVVFLFKNIPKHIGVVVDNYRFLHIFENSTAHISRFSKWKKRFHSAWRIRGD
ncbi:MAG: C40 family peptidase [bacterium]